MGRTTLALAAMLAVSLVVPAPARAKKPSHVRHLVTVQVHTHYTEPANDIDGVECRGLATAPPRPDCGLHYVGPATFTGTMWGDVHYDMYSQWQPDGTLRYSGPDYIDGGVEGCGKGTFVIEDTEGVLDFKTWDRNSNSAQGYNKWHLRKGSGTGELVNLVDGAGENNWREYFDGGLKASDKAGEGDFTGWITCWR